MVLLSPGVDSVLTMVLGWCVAQVGAERDARRDHRHRPRPGAHPSARRRRRLARDRPDVGVVAGSGIAAGDRQHRRRLPHHGRRAGGARRCRTASTAATSPSPPRTREPFELGRFVRSFWVSPRAHPDFAWAWITRFLMNLGNALLLLYLLYYLKDAVDLTDKRGRGRRLPADRGVRPCISCSPRSLGGIWSDRLGRRKVFVIASGLIAAAALLLLAFVTTWAGAVVGAVHPRHRLRDLHGGRLRDDHRGAARRPTTAPRTSASSTSPTPCPRCSPPPSRPASSASASATPPSTSSPPASACSARSWWCNIKSLA